MLSRTSPSRSARASSHSNRHPQVPTSPSKNVPGQETSLSRETVGRGGRHPPSSGGRNGRHGRQETPARPTSPSPQVSSTPQHTDGPLGRESSSRQIVYTIKQVIEAPIDRINDIERLKELHSAGIQANRDLNAARPLVDQPSQARLKGLNALLQRKMKAIELRLKRLSSGVEPTPLPPGLELSLSDVQNTFQRSFKGYLSHTDDGASTNFNQLRSLIGQGIDASDRVAALRRDNHPLGSAPGLLKGELAKRSSNELFDELCAGVGMYQHFANQPLPTDADQAQQQLKVCEDLAAHMFTCLQMLVNRKYTLEGLRFGAHRSLLECFKAMQDGCRQARSACKALTPLRSPATGPQRPSKRKQDQPQVLIEIHNQLLMRFDNFKRAFASYPGSPYKPLQMWVHVQEQSRNADSDEDTDQLFLNLQGCKAGQINLYSAAVEHQLALYLMVLEMNASSVFKDAHAAIGGLRKTLTNIDLIEAHVKALQDNKLGFRPIPPGCMAQAFAGLKEIKKEILEALQILQALVGQDAQ